LPPKLERDLNSTVCELDADWVDHGRESGDQLRFMGNADLCGNQVGGVGRIAFLMQTLDQQVGDPSGAIHFDLWQSSPNTRLLLRR
jgi:hypothetical protein